ncbi:hypothetical protein A2Z22_01665 [Candidatus Woesebacteria bacterium RBG_16_34_12]|uniref:Uncharacterized protein n=1 Tax=Candidatus Woesebacteria bacterium RBG_16_34_12 TaxID=1802480 RepID=A0A1F7XA85_9BACT|nr:MAG: hypothetical protein A2Z22_01665 [Candidatus Woesebacteria bacterium RBG_16_34_12]
MTQVEVRGDHQPQSLVDIKIQTPDEIKCENEQRILWLQENLMPIMQDANLHYLGERGKIRGDYGEYPYVNSGVTYTSIVMTWDDHSSANLSDVYRIEICRDWKKDANQVMVSGGRRGKPTEKVVKLEGIDWKENAQAIIDEFLKNPESCHIYEDVPFGVWESWQSQNLTPFDRV